MSSASSRRNFNSTILCLALATMSCEFGHGLVVIGNQRTPFLNRGSFHLSKFGGKRSYPSSSSSSSSSSKSSSSMKMYLDDVLPTVAINLPSLSSTIVGSSSLLSSSITEAAASAAAAATTTTTTTSLSSLSSVLPPSLSNTNPSNIPMSIALSPAILTTLLTTTSQLVVSDPKLEAELLSDVSHVALDFTTFYSPMNMNTAWLRLCNVIGRILILSSDYIQDDYITPDEYFFQVSMLVVSIQMFVRSVWPVLHAALSRTTLTVRDRRAYTVFDEVGLSILQYRTLIATGTIVWEEIDAQEVLELKGDLCFLYSGHVEMEGSSLPSSSSFSSSEGSSSSSHSLGNRIFGEVPFSKAMEESMYKKKKVNKQDKIKKTTDVLHQDSSLSSSNAEEEESVPYPSTAKLIAQGPNGAILLRIRTSKLLELMSNDEQLAASIHRLVLLSMQEKLSRSFQVDSSPFSSSNSNSSSFNASNFTVGAVKV